MQALIKNFEQVHRKSALAPVRSGDTVRVHQRITEGGKSRVQVFEGVVIRTRRAGELMADVTVRRLSSGIGVEKTFLLHSPHVVKVEIVRRSKVRRNFLTYLRGRRGKSARLQELAFDRAAANAEALQKTEDSGQTADEATSDELQATSSGGTADEPGQQLGASNLSLDDAATDEPAVEAEAVEGDVPLEEVEKAEDKEAAAGDIAADPDAVDDEAAMPAAEVKEKLDEVEAKE